MPKQRSQAAIVAEAPAKQFSSAQGEFSVIDADFQASIQPNRLLFHVDQIYEIYINS